MKEIILEKRKTLIQDQLTFFPTVLCTLIAEFWDCPSYSDILMEFSQEELWDMRLKIKYRCDNSLLSNIVGSWENRYSKTTYPVEIQPLIKGLVIVLSVLAKKISHEKMEKELSELKLEAKTSVEAHPVYILETILRNPLLRSKNLEEFNRDELFDELEIGNFTNHFLYNCVALTSFQVVRINSSMIDIINTKNKQKAYVNNTNYIYSNYKDHSERYRILDEAVHFFFEGNKEKSKKRLVQDGQIFALTDYEYEIIQDHCKADPAKLQNFKQKLISAIKKNETYESNCNIDPYETAIQETTKCESLQALKKVVVDMESNQNIFRYNKAWKMNYSYTIFKMNDILTEADKVLPGIEIIKITL